jgi:hypothetical protein
MSVVPVVGPMINCDALGCRNCFEGSCGCDRAAEARIEARKEGWRVNVPQSRGPHQLRPLPFSRARLDFCPDHQGSVR